ncbi:MAG: tripartite tricarboxylate transporter substrate-binding protein [Rhizobiaceae bacterium]
MTRMNKRTLAAGVGACALLLGSSFGLTTFAGKSDAHAADFPSKPIEVVVPFKPGGRTDTVARLLGKKIQEKGWLSQPFVIVNAAGGGGANAVSRMKRGETDGHTAVHWHHQMLISIAMGLGNYDLSAFRSLGYTGGGSPVWAVRADSPFNSLEDVVNHLKKEPRSLVEAVGIGSIPHFVGAMLAKQGGFETRYVTANSGADRLRLLLGGTADIALFAASEYTAQGRGLKALVYFGKERLPNLPDLPTALELGYDVSWANPNWWLVPAGTPDAEANAISAALEKAIADPDIIKYFKENTLQPYWVPGAAAMEDAQKQLSSLKPIAETIN